MDLPPVQPILPPTSQKPAQLDAKDRAAWEAATEFEAAFLAEMLKTAGLNASPSGFGGGAGEEAFSSFLTQEYGRLLAERGGVGVAEQVFESIKQRNESQ